MSKKRISDSAGRVKVKQLPKGPSGRALCRVCSKEVPKGRRSFCSEDCVHEHKIRTQPAYVRKCLFERDRGVCAICGVDTVILEQEEAKRLNAARGNLDRFKAACIEFKQKVGSHPGARRAAGYWDADHVKPVTLGGGECGLDGYRTLCIPCHKAETAKLRKKLAKGRR